MLYVNDQCVYGINTRRLEKCKSRARGHGSARRPLLPMGLQQKLWVNAQAHIQADAGSERLLVQPHQHCTGRCLVDLMNLVSTSGQHPLPICA